MRFSFRNMLAYVVALCGPVVAYAPRLRRAAVSRPMRVSMVLDERQSEGVRTQGLDGVNQMKLESDFLRHPLVEDLANMETISISHDSYNLLKFHGSYQQDDREKRKKGAEKAWQFMLRLKVPSGEVPGPLYLVLDDLQRSAHNTIRHFLPPSK